MAKGRISPQELKRDPLMEQYLNTATWVKGRSQPILKWVTIGAVVLALVAIVWLFMSRRASNAAEAMAEAFRYHDAVVSNPIPPGVKGYAFATEEEKDRKAYEAFEKAARDYPSYNGEVGRFYAATHQLNFEPDKAEATLKELSQKDSPVGAQARLALAGRYDAAGKLDEALAEYNKLKAKPYSVPTQLIEVNMAAILEAQGKTAEAVELYFNVAKDVEWRSTGLGNRAANRLSILSPDKYAQLPEPKPSNPLGGFGGSPMFQ